MSFHRLLFLFAISSILSSKKEHFDFLTELLKLHQFSRLWERQYFLSERQQSSFHHALECLVIFTSLEFLCQDSLILKERSWTTSSRVSASWIEDIFKLLMIWVIFLINYSSSSLPFASDHRVCNILSLQMNMSMVIGAWFDESLQSGWIW